MHCCLLYRLEDEESFGSCWSAGRKNFGPGLSQCNFSFSWFIKISHSEAIEEDGSKPASFSGRKPDLGFGPSTCDGFANQNLGVGDSLKMSHLSHLMEGPSDATKPTNEDCRMI